jgi:hypothetical protein
MRPLPQQMVVDYAVLYQMKKRIASPGPDSFCFSLSPFPLILSMNNFTKILCVTALVATEPRQRPKRCNDN